MIYKVKIKLNMDFIHDAVVDSLLSYFIIRRQSFVAYRINIHVDFKPPVVCSTDRSKAVVPVLVILFVALWSYSTRRFVVCLSVCHFVFFSPFSIAITSLGEERANLSAFRTFVRFVLVWICRFPLPLGVWEGLRFVIVTLPGLFSYLFFFS